MKLLKYICLLSRNESCVSVSEQTTVYLSEVFVFAGWFIFLLLVFILLILQGNLYQVPRC